MTSAQQKLMDDICLHPISALMPHAPPMQLITRLLKVTSDEVLCEVEISPNSIFFDSELHAVPAWIGIEYMAQTISLYSGVQTTIQGKMTKIGFLLGSRTYVSDVSHFLSGWLLKVHATKLYQDEFGLGAFQGEIIHDGKNICHATLNVFSPQDVDAFFKDNPSNT